MKQWTIRQTWTAYLLGALMYIVGMNFLAFSYRLKNIAVATAMAVMFNIILLSLISIFWYKEVPTIKQYIGLALSLVVIILLE